MGCIGGINLARGQIFIEVGLGLEADADELERNSLWLRDELLQLDVESVEPILAEAAPAGAKGSPGGAAGWLVLSLSNSPVAVALAKMLSSWVDRRSGRKVTLRIGDDLLEVSRVSVEDQAKLIAAWLDRHAEF